MTGKKCQKLFILSMWKLTQGQWLVGHQINLVIIASTSVNVSLKFWLVCFFQKTHFLGPWKAQRFIHLQLLHVVWLCPLKLGDQDFYINFWSREGCGERWGGLSCFTRPSKGCQSAWNLACHLVPMSRKKKGIDHQDWEAKRISCRKTHNLIVLHWHLQSS